MNMKNFWTGVLLVWCLVLTGLTAFAFSQRPSLPTASAVATSAR